MRSIRINEDRYSLFVSDRASPLPAIRVYDRAQRRVLLRWQGEVARRLLDADDLPLAYLTNGSHRCDKALLRRLTIAAASIGMGLEQPDDRTGPCRTDRQLPLLHSRVAGLLFDHPDHHFAHEEIICLMGFRFPCIAPRHIEKVLDDLVDSVTIQRVTVNADAVFYDIDTRPHLHVYDARCQELRDADFNGVLRLV